jgi:hypothetical protein
MLNRVDVLEESRKNTMEKKRSMSRYARVLKKSTKEHGGAVKVIGRQLGDIDSLLQQIKQSQQRSARLLETLEQDAITDASACKEMLEEVVISTLEGDSGDHKGEEGEDGGGDGQSSEYQGRQRMPATDVEPMKVSSRASVLHKTRKGSIRDAEYDESGFADASKSYSTEAAPDVSGKHLEPVRSTPGPAGTFITSL